MPILKDMMKHKMQEKENAVQKGDDNVKDLAKTSVHRFADLPSPKPHTHTDLSTRA